MSHIEDHDRGLAHDLAVIRERMIGRRRALAWFATAGTGALLAGCGGSDDGDSSVSSSTLGTGTTTTTTTTTGSTSTGSTGTTTTGTSTSSGTCVADPTETAGPYPGDGTNTARGATSNVLTQSGIIRSDIRPSFLNSTTVAEGVKVTLTLTLVDVNAACGRLAGYAIYLWQCDRDGNYSLYTATNESYLRGVQVTDANGQVTFTTIFPACYDGRWPHMHFEVFSSIANATSGRYAVLTSQFAMPSDLCRTLYATATGYTTSQTRFSSVSLSSDNVFGDNTSAQITAMTPSFTGDVTNGYTATATVGIAR